MMTQMTWHPPTADLTRIILLHRPVETTRQMAVTAMAIRIHHLDEHEHERRPERSKWTLEGIGRNGTLTSP